MEENRVFVTEYMDIPTLKKYCIFFNKLIFYPAAIQTGGVLNSHFHDVNNLDRTYYGDEVIRWLFDNRVVRIDMKQEEVNDIFKDKCIIGFKIEEDFISQHHKDFCINQDITQKEEELVKLVSDIDNKDRKLTDYMDRVKFNLHKRDVILTLAQRRITPVMNQGVYDEMLSKFKQLYSKTWGRIKLNDFTMLNKNLIRQTTISNHFHSGPYASAFCHYKFRNETFEANKVSKIMEGVFTLDLIGIEDVNKLSFDDILMIRSTKHWKQAMVELTRMSSSLASKDDYLNEEAIKKIKENINSRLLNSIDEAKLGKKLALSATNITKSLIVDCIPFLKTPAGIIDSARPIVEYLHKAKNQNSIVMFIKELEKLRVGKLK